MKKVLNLVAVAGLTLMASAAHAQVPKILGGGDIKVGVFSPTGSDAKDNSNTTQLSVGVDYTPPGLPGTSRPTFYGDFHNGSKDGGHVNVVGVGVATKYSQGLVGQLTKVTPYFGFGVGAYRIDVKNNVTGESGKATTIGGKAFAGITFSKWVLEASYQLLPSQKGINPSGVGVQLGVTF